MQPSKKNINQQEYKLIKALRNNPDITIKLADKGVVIMNKVDSHTWSIQTISNVQF